MNETKRLEGWKMEEWEMAGREYWASVLAWTYINDYDFSVTQLHRRSCISGLEFLGTFIYASATGV